MFQVKGITYPPGNYSNPDLPFFEGCNDESFLQRVFVCYSAMSRTSLDLQSADNELFLLWGEESRCHRVIWQGVPDERSDNDGQKSLEDEDPVTNSV